MSVYTPAKLAERWECSERHIRNMLLSGELPYFRLGDKLLRIRSEDVEAFECRNGDSQGYEGDTMSLGTTTESADVISLEQTIPKRRVASPRLDLPHLLGRGAQR
jgi:excisionase family DNA binding protein